MRRLLGYLLLALGLLFLVMLFLRLWDIAPMNWDLIVRLFLTLVLALVGAALVAAVRYLFFQDLPMLRRYTRRAGPDEPEY